MKRGISFPAVAAVAYAALAAQAAWGLPPAGFTLCPFKLLTGRDCPGCGMGHAVVYAMRGDWAASFRAHLLGAPLFFLWSAWMAWGGLNLARGRGFSEGFLPVLRRPAAAWAMLALVLVVYAARLAGFALV